LLGLALLVAVKRRAADQPVDKPLDRAFLAAEEAADIVAEASVPFLPAVSDERAHLVQAGRIPRFGDELRPRQCRLRLDIPQHRWVRDHLARRAARQDRREVEPEPIDVHRLHPVSEAIHDHATDDRMIGVERVSRAAVVGVPRSILFKHVVRRVVQPAEAQRRPTVVAFGSVVRRRVYVLADQLCCDLHRASRARIGRMPKENQLKMTSHMPSSSECLHGGMEYLGENRDAWFLRCASCGNVFVLQAGRLWAIPALRSREWAAPESRGANSVT
jgi:hypothetical protein